MDLMALKEWLENMLGGEFLEEHLAVGQVILERLAKYLLLPGLELNLNLNVRVVAQACEVTFRVDTPADVRERGRTITRSRSRSRSASAHAHAALAQSRDRCTSEPDSATTTSSGGGGGGGSTTGNGNGNGNRNGGGGHDGISPDETGLGGGEAGLTAEMLSEHGRLSSQMTGRQKVEGIESALNTEYPESSHYPRSQPQARYEGDQPQSEKSSEGLPPSLPQGSRDRRWSDLDSASGGSRILDPMTEDDLKAKEEPYALHMAIVLNLMDVVEDAKSVLKALKDAKRAYADHASERAMRAMGESNK